MTPPASAPPALPRTTPQPSWAWALFYPAAALAAAGMALLSFGPALVNPAGAQIGFTSTPAGPMLGPAGLAKATPDAWHVTYTARAGNGAPQGLRLAVKPGAPADTAGVVVALTAEAGAALSDKPVRLTLNVRPIADTIADTLAVRLVGAGGAGPWVSLAPKEGGALIYDLPSVSGVRAIALRATSSRTDFNLGVEITTVLIGAPP